MENSINISILIPLIPMGMALLILSLLVSFNRTINRLTKPVSALAVFSLLSSALISAFLYLKKIEGEVFLSDYLKLFGSTNLTLHLNSLTEKIVIFFAVIIAIVIGVLFYKLPRRKGYVSLIIGISLISSSIMFAVFFLDFSVLI
ncbi:NADH-quinone oxidoreductase [Prochlorococcus sp. AH-716-I19]|nr:NADH-quinone oxidoreductase [Prochlorococcus sp. AH-716-I19]